MLKITVLTVGKLKEDHWQAAQAEFLKRLRPFAKIEVVEVAAAPITPSFGPERSMADEAARLIARLPKDAAVITLDRRGEKTDSESLAKWLETSGASGRHLVFVIGGAAGLDGKISTLAQKKISLSGLTFTHEMARIILLEQLYRSATISAGKKYHY
ncbi:MAG: 23S rRNA (pseudouridine(1915)-N(3))-methyltransferase RlmH [Patescibacteria group bacterium]|jgi:23S rRNA (pseudouridine1915-N3)-methyltransferase